jgi:hypothetical protein
MHTHAGLIQLTLSPIVHVCVGTSVGGVTTTNADFTLTTGLAGLWLTF